MQIKEAVLDASAVLALIKREPGAERVAEFLGAAVMSTVNLSEVLKRLEVDGVDAKKVVKDLNQAGIDTEPFEESQAALCAEIAGKTKRLGLSLGDRACLALALFLNRQVVVTADRAWRELDLVDSVLVIR